MADINMNANAIESPETPQGNMTLIDPCEIKSDDTKIRLFEIWPGNNRFFWQGRIMLGPR